MPALIGPLLGFCLGVLFGWVGQSGGAPDRAAVKHRGALLVGAFSVLVYAPVCAYFLAFAPDWAVAYWFNAGELPPALSLLWVLVDASAPIVGFLIATHGDQLKPRSLVRLASGPAVVALALFVISYRRLGVHATYRQFQEDFGINQVTGTPLGYALIWMLGLLVLAAAWTARGLSRLAGRQLSLPRPLRTRSGLR